jgi:hypothetical protein
VRCGGLKVVASSSLLGCLNPRRAGKPCAGVAIRVRHVHESVTRLCHQRTKGRAVQGTSELSEATAGQRRSAPSFRPDQIDAMHKAFEQVRTRMGLTGAKAIPVVELVAIRIVELAVAGEFDPDKLTDIVLAEFDV